MFESCVHFYLEFTSCVLFLKCWLVLKASNLTHAILALSKNCGIVLNIDFQH